MSRNDAKIQAFWKSIRRGRRVKRSAVQPVKMDRAGKPKDRSALREFRQLMLQILPRAPLYRAVLRDACKEFDCWDKKLRGISAASKNYHARNPHARQRRKAA